VTLCCYLHLTKLSLRSSHVTQRPAFEKRSSIRILLTDAIANLAAYPQRGAKRPYHRAVVGIRLHDALRSVITSIVTSEIVKHCYVYQLSLSLCRSLCCKWELFFIFINIKHRVEISGQYAEVTSTYNTVWSVLYASVTSIIHSRQCCKLQCTYFMTTHQMAIDTQAYYCANF